MMYACLFTCKHVCTRVHMCSRTHVRVHTYMYAPTYISRALRSILWASSTPSLSHLALDDDDLIAFIILITFSLSLIFSFSHQVRLCLLLFPNCSPSLPTTRSNHPKRSLSLIPDHLLRALSISFS